ncbi:protein MAIN-LIKE 2-like [Vicia villosa]|uniref:protein MAIN-LIKE 2-like n=1 Tax=Vicia villosa TaxID=3911 RepID=UPI00273B54DB|nr:protein MAIN-LIKE 2-like [Vicia villosa]
MDKAPGGSSSVPRSRLSWASSSREVSREEKEVHEEVPDVHLEHNDDGQDDAQDAQDGGYLGGPSDTFVLIYYHDHAARYIWDSNERAPIKFVNHLQKIFNLFKPHAQWFNDVVAGSELSGLCMTEYSTISHGMQGAFAEMWPKETPSFHFPVGELTITLHDVDCMLHLLIRERLLDHSQIQRVEAIEWMVDYLGMDPYMADYECRATNGAHIQFSSRKELYENHLVAASEFQAEGDGVFVEYHRACVLRCWLIFLVGTSLFVDQSTTYMDMTYLKYFIDLTIFL